MLRPPEFEHLPYDATAGMISETSAWAWKKRSVERPAARGTAGRIARDSLRPHADLDRIERLRHRIHIAPTTEADAPGVWPWAAEVIVDLPGEQLRATVDLPPGALASGLAWTDVEEKVRDLFDRCGLGGVDRSLLTEVRRIDAAPTTPLAVSAD